MIKIKDAPDAVDMLYYFKNDGDVARTYQNYEKR